MIIIIIIIKRAKQAPHIRVTSRFIQYVCVHIHIYMAEFWRFEISIKVKLTLLRFNNLSKRNQTKAAESFRNPRGGMYNQENEINWTDGALTSRRYM